MADIGQGLDREAHAAPDHIETHTLTLVVCLCDDSIRREHVYEQRRPYSFLLVYIHFRPPICLTSVRVRTSSTLYASVHASAREITNMSCIASCILTSKMSKPLIPPLPSDYITAHSYSITIPNVTVQEAFDKLLSQKAMRDVGLLSTWATRFEITKVDRISLPSQSSSLAGEKELWKLPASSNDAEGKGLERVFFEMSEVAPYVFGLYKAHLEIVGCQTIDATANTILYESYAAPSVSSLICVQRVVAIPNSCV